MTAIVMRAPPRAAMRACARWLLCGWLLTGCASQPREPATAAHTAGSGYLDAIDIPDSLALVPPPPAPGTAAFASDAAVQRAAFALRGTPRWRLATSDADLRFPHAAGLFECAIGVPIGAVSTPRLYALLRDSAIDAGASTRRAKEKYARVRPFARNAQPTCTPEDEDALRRNGSYPSGHTAIGWAWALTVAEAAPAQADAVLARGRAFGESRLVCNVHWQSDVLEGRFLGAATVERLHASGAYRDDLIAARGEIQRLRSQGRKPARDCGAEAAALAARIAGAL